MNMNKPGQMLKSLRQIDRAYDAAGYDLSSWPGAAAAEIEHLADALMERERDARRYRWLREEGPMNFWMNNGRDITCAEELDQAIDRAMMDSMAATNIVFSSGHADPLPKADDRRFTVIEDKPSNAELRGRPLADGPA